ncbi:GAF domain-containing protein [Paraburkholderia sp. CNPSo 3157]|uniref:GAF domain-containing protein n=1 Tax=Paraburkholderia franconis TaxID=2654983 RepID=A0A7X1TJM4_9BURK|nr:GAF domain-containing protein [Paraburkholderia franconis]MPW21641.1 GAF domain-containing protein [Paraburkholderia franconis]
MNDKRERGLQAFGLQPFFALARAQAHANQPATLYRALDTVLAETIGHTLFTILRYDATTNESARVYSNLPNEYPTAAKKPLAGGSWVDTVLTRGDAFIGRTADDLRAVFPDHELIASLGCESVLNVPVRWKGRTLASLNLLHTRAWYRDDHVPFAQSLAQFALPTLLDDA